MSATGGKADIPFCTAHVRLRSKADIAPSSAKAKVQVNTMVRRILLPAGLDAEGRWQAVRKLVRKNLAPHLDHQCIHLGSGEPTSV